MFRVGLLLRGFSSNTSIPVCSARLLSSKGSKLAKELEGVQAAKRRVKYPKSKAQEVADVPKKKAVKARRVIKAGATEDSALPTNSKPQGPAPQYILLSNMPKVPESILKKPAADLCKEYGISLDPFGNKDGSLSLEKVVDFVIPDKFLKSKIREQITDKDRAMLDELERFLKYDDEKDIYKSQLTLTKLYFDLTTNSYQMLPEHPLKKSLSGLVSLNPHLEDVEDEYLWDLIPQEDLFGRPPFEEKFDINGFKKWEEKELEKLSAEEKHKKEYEDFKLLLHKNGSFYKTVGGRTKLDRKLVRQYKKLKLEGKVPSNDDDDEKL